MKKRKIALLALALLACVCMTLAATACGKDDCTHEWRNTSVRTAPTCEAGGSQEQECTLCAKKQTVTLPALGHSYTDGVCTVCGKRNDVGTAGLEYEYREQDGGYVLMRYTGGEEVVNIPYFYNDGTHGEHPVIGIKESVFNSKWFITDVSIPDSVRYIGEAAFYKCGNIKNAVIPSSVRTVGKYAFYECRELSSVSGMGGVISIGDEAFCGSKITSVRLPKTLSEIGDAVFYNCEGLVSLTVEEGNAKYHSDGNCIIETAAKKLVVGCKTSVIPTDGSITEIGRKAFYSYPGLVSVTVPEGVTRIGEMAFAHSEDITSITLPASLRVIEYGAFRNALKLQSIVIPDGITDIASSMFEGCTSLKSVTVPRSVTYIGSSAFEGCTSLETIMYKGTLEQWEAISKGNGWDYSVSATIVPSCYDEGGDHLCDVCGEKLSDCADGDDDHSCDICGERISDCTDKNGDHKCDLCGEKVSEHSFVLQNAEAKYLASAATCSSGATYYYSCACGASEGNGEHVFEHGAVDPDNHISVTWIENGGQHQKRYSCCNITEEEKSGHTFDGGNTCTKCGASASEGITFLFNSQDGGYYIQKYDGSDTDVMIPDTYDDGTNGKHYVVGSYAYAFADKDITSIVFPYSMIYIASDIVGGCTKLTSVVFSDGGNDDLYIYSYAFEGCTALKSITLPSRVVFLSSKIFYESGITTIAYDGTSEELAALTKDTTDPSRYWYTGIGEECSVICSDKTINISVKAKEATADEDGNIAYYYDFVNGKYYTSNSFNTEIADKNGDGVRDIADTVIPRTAE